MKLVGQILCTTVAGAALFGLSGFTAPASADTVTTVAGRAEEAPEGADSAPGGTIRFEIVWLWVPTHDVTATFDVVDPEGQVVGTYQLTMRVHSTPIWTEQSSWAKHGSAGAVWGDGLEQYYGEPQGHRHRLAGRSGAGPGRRVEPYLYGRPGQLHVRPEQPGHRRLTVTLGNTTWTGRDVTFTHPDPPGHESIAWKEAPIGSEPVGALHQIADGADVIDTSAER